MNETQNQRPTSTYHLLVRPTDLGCIGIVREIESDAQWSALHGEFIPNWEVVEEYSSEFYLSAEAKAWCEKQMEGRTRVTGPGQDDAIEWSPTRDYGEEAVVKVFRH